MTMAQAWFQEAWDRRVQPNPDAMVIATAGEQGAPSARVVLCKQIVADPGYLVFFTNYHSRKGLELGAHPRAAAVLFWDALHRQLRVEGPVVQSPDGESDEYFASRPRQRRVGAWASQQSQPVESRLALNAAVAQAEARFSGSEAPRPPHWGGYRLWAESVELWVEGNDRIHDRAHWTRRLDAAPGGFTGGPWSVTRLQP
jgi:pyridoxamine 5'-phosphate oxidase